MRVWRHDAKTRQLEPLLDEARVASAAFDSTGFGINAVPITGEKIRQWRGGTAWADAPNVLLGREMQVGWSLDGSRLLTKSSPGARIAVGSVNDRKWIDLGAAARNQEVVFDAQGSRVVADTVGGIYVWKLSQGQAEDKPIGALLPKAGDTAQFAAFNHDGSRVVILDVRKVARVFSSDGTGSPIELAGRFQAVSFDDDSSHVIGVMDDGRILRRRIGWETMIDALDRATTACLTPGQRTQFFAESADVAQAASLACQERKRQR
jgi:hypothetical protein